MNDISRVARRAAIGAVATTVALVSAGLGLCSAARAQDGGVIRMIVTDARAAVRGYLAGILRHEPAWSDHRRGIARGLPVGLRAGWGEFRGQDRVS